MDIIFENSDLMKSVMVSLNSKFPEIHKKLSIRYKIEKESCSLKLLDGKWGNFCYCPDEFLAMSVSRFLDMGNDRGIAILLYTPFGSDNPIWVFSKERYLFWNVNHDRDNLEKSSSQFARSVIKRMSSIETFDKASSYMDSVEQERKSKFLL